MSTIVQPRREAATYVSTHAGAVGEMIVDTTSQRVTVHDGATLGGFPQAQIGDLPGRNAIINGNFAINQRGYASGGSLAAGAYAHDRWKAGTAGAYTFSQSNADTAVTITSGTLIQAIDVGNVYASSVWLTWQGTATARVWQGSASGAFLAGVTKVVGGVTVNALLVTGLALGTVTNVEFGSGTLGLVQLEAALPNAGPTRFERRHGELAICQRYYATTVCTLYYVAASASPTQSISGFLPVAMRANPTLTLSTTAVSSGGSTTSVITSSPQAFQFSVASTAAAGASVYNYNQIVIASAEL